jgi:DNA polymerase I-like protein with 3'-5' exonuclease and polymerase domains
VDLVAPYAIGDVVRTRKLFDLLHNRIKEQGMEAAYDRERELMPTMVEATRRGIRIDRHTLEHHEKVYSRALSIADDRIRDLLGHSNFEVGGEGFADALDRAGFIEEWVLTPTGKRSMAKENLKIAHPEVKKLYEYRSAIETCLTTFMRPWLEKSKGDDRVHPNWNQVRQARDAKNSKGTRTNRLSSDDPNFQNVPTEYEDRYGEPLAVPDGLIQLPLMRSYCLPEEGHVWLKRDYSGQELRILAHFEDGPLAEAYIANPNLDPHHMAQELIRTLVGLELSRKPVKIVGFSLLYGTGVTGLSGQLKVPYPEAYTIKEAYLTAMPGIRDLMDGVRKEGEAGRFIRTWGGRIYYAEKGIDKKTGKHRDYSYKLLNYLIQGSAADQTKQAVIDWRKAAPWDNYLLATVHDEINISAPEDRWKECMAILKEQMNAPRLDVPVTSEGYMGPNWQEIEKLNELES